MRRSLHQGLRAGHHSSHELAKPALQLIRALLQKPEYRADRLEMLADEPDENVGVQRPTALSFDLASESKHRAKHASTGRCCSCSVCAPFSGTRAAALAPASKRLRPDVEDHLQEEPDQQLEHHGLRNRVLGNSAHHLTILRQHIHVVTLQIQTDLLALDDQEERLLVVSRVGRGEGQRRTKGFHVCNAFMSTKPPVTVSADDICHG